MHPTSLFRILFVLILWKKQALLWCIDRENPVLPQSETDHPVQFWQLRKANGKVSGVLFSTSTSVHTFHFRHFTLIVCHNPSSRFPTPLTFLKVATKTPQEMPPILGRGALCADSMGLYVFPCPTCPPKKKLVLNILKGENSYDDCSHSRHQI